MAQHTVVQFVSDLSGHESDPDNGEAVETYRFGQGKFVYEIDLTESEGAKFMELLDEYTEHARKLGPLATATSGRTSQRTSSAASGRDREQSQAIRAWARSAGHEVSDRGRIPDAIVEEFNRAHTR